MRSFLLLVCSVLLIGAAALSQTTGVKKPFTEGIIKGKVSTPGNMFGELMGKIDFSKNNVQEQMEAIMSKWTEEEMERYQKDMKKAGMLVMALTGMPMRFTIWNKAQLSVCRYDALNYHGETKADLGKQTGMMFMKSSRNDDELTLSYTGEQMQKMCQQILTKEDYDIIRTNENTTVAGYPCMKCVYTLKSTENLPAGKAAPGNDKPYRVEVWSSTLIPKSLNFLHPLYVEETNGIMKLLVSFDKAESLKLQYEFVSVENKTIAESELTIQKSAVVHDAGNEKVLLGLVQKLMSITMGMTQ